MACGSICGGRGPAAEARVMVCGSAVAGGLQQRGNGVRLRGEACSGGARACAALRWPGACSGGATACGCAARPTAEGQGRACASLWWGPAAEGRSTACGCAARPAAEGQGRARLCGGGLQRRGDGAGHGGLQRKGAGVRLRGGRGPVVEGRWRAAPRGPGACSGGAMACGPAVAEGLQWRGAGMRLHGTGRQRIRRAVWATSHGGPGRYLRGKGTKNAPDAPGATSRGQGRGGGGLVAKWRTLGFR
jgi:hypothetical protein